MHGELVQKCQLLKTRLTEMKIQVDEVEVEGELAQIEAEMVMEDMTSL